MKTMVFGEGIVELGANWIHGATLSNSVFTLAAQNNLLYPYVLLDRYDNLTKDRFMKKRLILLFCHIKTIYIKSQLQKLHLLETDMFLMY